MEACQLSRLQPSYFINWHLCWKESPGLCAPRAATRTSGGQPRGWAVDASPTPNVRRTEAFDAPPTSNIRRTQAQTARVGVVILGFPGWKKLRNFSYYGILKNNFSLSHLYYSFQDTSQVHILSGIWPKEINYSPFITLRIWTSLVKPAPQALICHCPKLFSIRPFVKSIYQTLHLHKIGQRFSGFKTKAN